MTARNTTTATTGTPDPVAAYVKACRATERVEKEYGTALDGMVDHLHSVLGNVAWWEPNPEGDIKKRLEIQKKVHANAWAEGFKDPKKIKAERSKASVYWKRILTKVRADKKGKGENETESTDISKSNKELVTIYNRGTKEGAEPESIALSKELKPLLLARGLIKA